MELDSLFKAIQASLAEEAKRLCHTRSQFRVTFRNNAYPERFVSHYFHSAIARCTKSSSVVLEVPFQNTTMSKHDNHLDALIFNDEIAVLAEFKRAWIPRHWEYLRDDVERVQKRFAPEIRGRFEVKEPKDEFTKSRRLFAFYGMDAWRQEIVESWINGTPFKKWSRPPEFATMKLGSTIVWKLGETSNSSNIIPSGNDYDGYYFLWALEDLDKTSAHQEIALSPRASEK